MEAKAAPLIFSVANIELLLKMKLGLALCTFISFNTAWLVLRFIGSAQICFKLSLQRL